MSKRRRSPTPRDRSGSDRAERSPAAVRIILFACGHGDTILITVAGPPTKSLLIDCHLPKVADRRRFLQLLAAHGVESLDLVMLTHPHLDHYAGMADLLQHFADAGHPVRIFCDCGANWRNVAELLAARGCPQEALKEYARLAKVVCDLSESQKMARPRLDDNHLAIPIGETNGSLLIPVGPDATLLQNSTDSFLMANRSSISTNALSIIFILRVTVGQARFEALFTADAEREGLMHAYHVWQRREETSHLSGFDVVKIPHHGSENGHWEELCRMRKKSRQRCIAAASAGTLYDLPHQTVRNDYESNGWTVVATNTKPIPTTRTRMLEAFGKGHSVAQPNSADVKIEWSPRRGVTSEELSVKS